MHDSIIFTVLFEKLCSFTCNFYVIYSSFGFIIIKRIVKCQDIMLTEI